MGRYEPEGIESKEGEPRREHDPVQEYMALMGKNGLRGCKSAKRGTTTVCTTWVVLKTQTYFLNWDSWSQQGKKRKG